MYANLEKALEKENAFIGKQVIFFVSKSENVSRELFT